MFTLPTLLLWSDMAEALTVIEEQHDMAEALAAESPTEAVLAVLAQALAEMGKPAEAMTALEKALAIEKKAAEDNPTDIWAHINLAITYNRIGELLVQTGRPDEALQAHEQTRALLQKPARSQTAFREVKRELSVSLEKSGVLLAASGKTELALATCQEALAIRQNLSDAQPALTRLRGELAGSLSALGIVQLRTGHPAEAVVSLRRGIAEMEKLPTHSPRNCYNLACWHAQLAGIAADAASGLTLEQSKAETERAMATLQQAIDCGFNALGLLRIDASLDPLRPRADFQKLLKELEAKVAKMLERAPPPSTK